jgi:Tol biopolymer transport system component
MVMAHCLRVMACVLALAAFAPASLFAQGDYFGQNKVQYHKFDFQVMKTDHFDIYFYPEEEEAAKMAARMAERWYARLSTLLNHELRGRQPLILYASGPHFRETNTVQGAIGEGTGGVTEAFKRRIVLPFAGPLEATDHVLGHELVHAFQYDITNTNVSSNNAGALALPLWFIEGLAEYLSIGPVDPHTAMWMREAARREKLPKIKDLDNPKYFPYRYGQAVWAFIGGKYGDKVVGDMLRQSLGREGIEGAFAEVLGVKEEELTALWHQAEFAAYKPVADVTQMPAEFARAVIVNEKGGRLNASPELSPDGSKIMFFSERDLFSIDLFLADAKTGKVIRKITDTATSPHFESLQFLVSAGSWDAAGERFVFPGISKGEPVLTIVNVNNARTEREIRVPELDEILNPAWSPDGSRIAFSGLVGGLNDLFVYDLNASQLKRLTTDAFAELDPAWSPDSRFIAFSTDRFTTQLPELRMGHLRLAVMDAATGAVREAGGFEGAKNISPQWAADGRTLFFLSDRGGITNIYRAPVDGGQATQLTNLLSGVSGITDKSPALSVAQGRLVFSAYENDGYTIYSLDSAEQLTGVAPTTLPVNAAVLPPRTRGEGPVYASLENRVEGLPPGPAAKEVEPYKPGLKLDYAGQPTVGVGADPFGTYATGGMSFLFSDMLGNHTLGTSVQVTSRFDEFGGSLFYINRSRRWNWGAGIAQTPYVYRAYNAGISGDTYVEQEFRFLQIDRSISGLTAYPFSRAARVEFTGGVRQIGLKQDVRQRTYDLFTGQQIDQEDFPLADSETLNLGQASAALVYDTSIPGVTSPIRGRRSRLEVSQSTGTLQYSGVLGDFRTYFMPKQPFTFAFRGLYYGRYGRDAESGRLPTMFLGYPGLVRGYDQGSFQAGECGIQADGSCPVFDQLIGSRIGVVNAELRFPLWGAFGGQGFYGPLPVELAIFGDAGIAMGRTEGFSGINEKWVKSVGVAARVNVLGFAVAEINYVRPIDRRGRGWIWQFNFSPGF